MYANAKTTKVKGNDMINHQSILTNKPSFNLRINCDHSKIKVYMNGVEIFKNKRISSTMLDFPINDFITSGHNKLELLMLGSSMGTKRLSSDTECKVTLFVRKFNNFDTPSQDIFTLKYKHKAKDKLEGTTSPGMYNSKKQFKCDDAGDVKISQAIFVPFENKPLSASNGVIASIDFSLPTPFPRWKYLDGHLILHKEYYSLTLPEAIKLQKEDTKLKKLYELNHRIYLAAKNKDIDTLVSFFSERNKEMDIAYFKNKGTTEKELRRDFEKDIADKEQALRDISEYDWEQHKSTFVVERGDTLAYLKAILAWNSIGYSGSASYTMKFRWDGENWILTR
jgi:hypothetical protein